jgi:hypothetical protein
MEESFDAKFYKKNFDGLKKVPFVKFLLKENKKLEKENAELKDTVFKLCKRLLEKDEPRISNTTVIEDDEVMILKTPKTENIIYEIQENDDGDFQRQYHDIVIKPEKHQDIHVVLQEDEDVEVVVVEEEEEDEEVEVEVEVVVEEEDQEEEEEEEQEEQEEQEEDQEEQEEDQEEDVVEEEEEEVVEEEEEEVVEEQEEDQEEEVVEEDVVEEDVVEEEEVEEEEEEEDVVVVEEEGDDEVYEITINSKPYYVTNEINSIIYEADLSGDISIEAGIYKNGKPTFYKK